jgi:diguanylate cyclase (GGDEF)-like protein/PAS domain S-box-containing protein
VPEHADAMFRVVVETSPYLYTVVREDLTLAYVNPAVLAILGYEPEALVGRLATDIIHPDDFDIALGALSQLVAEYGDRPEGGVPMPVRLIRADGSLALVELGAIPRLDDPDVRGTIIRGRPMAGQQSLDQAIEALVASSPLEVVLEFLVTSLEHELRGARVAMGYGWDGEGFSSIIAPHLPPALSGGTLERDLDEPWIQAMVGREPVAFAAIDELPAPVRAAARELDLSSCWVRPIRASSADVPVACLVVWRSLSGLPLVSHEVALERAGRLTALAFERHRVEDLLRHAALHDNLTGVANRSQFFLRLHDETAPVAGATPAVAGRGLLLAVLYLDLDDFKPVNDTYGHGHGDELLRIVTARITATVRPGDLVARLGGDEFAVLCPDVRDAAEATGIAERLLHEIARPVDLGAATVQVGLSDGIAVGDRGAVDGPQLLAAGDTALYAAKRAGKGQWRLAP